VLAIFASASLLFQTSAITLGRAERTRVWSQAAQKLKERVLELILDIDRQAGWITTTIVWVSPCSTTRPTAGNWCGAVRAANETPQRKVGMVSLVWSDRESATVQYGLDSIEQLHRDDRFKIS
jgi:hypothetical protein